MLINQLIKPMLQPRPLKMEYCYQCFQLFVFLLPLCNSLNFSDNGLDFSSLSTDDLMSSSSLIIQLIQPTSLSSDDIISLDSSVLLPLASSSSSLSTSTISPTTSSSYTTEISSTLTTTLVSTVIPSNTLASVNLTDNFRSVTSCSCDLQVQSCDTDCCCDPNCTPNDIETFSQCLNIEMSSLTSRCLSSTALFRSSLLSSRGSGLFCVYTDNYPGRTMFPTSIIVTTLNELNNQLLIFSRTGDLTTPPSSFTPSTNEFYKSGDPLSIIYDSGILGYLALPTSLNGDVCHDGNPITFLNNQTSTCTRYLRVGDRECSLFNALNYYNNFSLSTTPYLQNGNNSLIQFETRNIKCYNLISQQVSCDDTISPPVYNEASMICDNALLAIDYNVLHRGSQGLVKAFVDVSIGKVMSGPVQQQFSVHFFSVSGLDSNETNLTQLIEGTDVRRSGNPGYLDGQPVLAGTLLSDSNEVNVNLNQMDWLTVLKAGSRGECDGDRESVTFRDSMKTSCILRLASSQVLSGCEGITQQTLNLLLGAEPRVDRIAIYGNSDPRDLSQWIPLLDVTNIPNTVGCLSVITGIQFILLYSYSGQVNSPEAFITGAQIRFLTQDLTALCSGPLCSSSSPLLSLSLETTVTFVPAYSVPEEVLKTTSLTTRTLPEDFLYPLLMTNGRATNSAPIIPIIVLVTILLVILVL